MARCNIYSSSFNWRLVNGTDILHVHDQPVLSYMIGFTVASHILESTTITSQAGLPYLVKDITFHPFIHEFERIQAALAEIGRADNFNMRCYNGGVKIASRLRPVGGSGYGAGPSTPGKWYSFCEILLFIDSITSTHSSRPIWSNSWRKFLVIS